MSFNPDDYKKYTNYKVSVVEDGLIHVQFNNPKSLNAFSEQVWRDYQEILESIDRHPDTNVILVSSLIPRSFSTGLNIKESMAEMAKYAVDKKTLSKFIHDFQYAIGTPARITTPTIGLLNGFNLGLALDISATFSVRVAVADAKFSIAEIKVGITADIGSLQRLPALVNNKSKLYQYALTGEAWSAQDALDLGFVSKVVPDLETGYEEIIAIGKKINGFANWTVRGTKASIQDILHGKHADEGLLDVADINASNLTGTARAPNPIKL